MKNTRIIMAIALASAIALLAGCTSVHQVDFTGPFVGVAGKANGR